MNTILKKLEKYGDEFEDVTKSKIPAKIRSHGYKMFWDEICNDQDYLSSMIEVTTGKDGKISFVSNRIAGIVLMNADIDSKAFASVKSQMTLDRSRIRNLGLRKMDRYLQDNLLTLFLKREDIRISIGVKQKIISAAELFEGAKGYYRAIGKIGLILSDGEFQSMLCLDKEGTKVLARQVVDMSIKELKDAFYNKEAPKTNYRDLRYYILKSEHFKIQFPELVFQFYDDEHYVEFIDSISKHIIERLQVFDFELYSPGEIINSEKEIANVLRKNMTPQVEEIISDIEVLEKMLGIRPISGS